MVIESIIDAPIIYIYIITTMAWDAGGWSTISRHFTNDAFNECSGPGHRISSVRTNTCGTWPRHLAAWLGLQQLAQRKEDPLYKENQIVPCRSSLSANKRIIPRWLFGLACDHTRFDTFWPQLLINTHDIVWSLMAWWKSCGISWVGARTEALPSFQSTQIRRLKWDGNKATPKCSNGYEHLPGLVPSSFLRRPAHLRRTYSHMSWRPVQLFRY